MKLFFWVKVGATLFFRNIDFFARTAHVPCSVWFIFCFALLFIRLFVFSHTWAGTLEIDCRIWSKTRGQPSVKLDQHDQFVFPAQTYSSRAFTWPQKQKVRQLPDASCLLQSILFKKKPSWLSKIGIVNMLPRAADNMFCSFTLMYELMMRSLHVKEKKIFT